MVAREAPPEKNADLIYIQVNVLKSVTITTKRGSNMQIDYIGPEYLDVLGMLLKG